MKKIISTFTLVVIGLISFSQNYQVIISGNVTDIYSGSPVANKEIMIVTDSSAGGSAYYNTVFTDPNGFYFDQFSVYSGEQGIVEVSTYSCGTYMYNVGYYSSDSSQFNFDFQVCSDSIVECEASFDYFQIQSTEIQFFDQSIGNPNTWYWDFGDGSSSYEQNPLHVYNDFGFYDVTLTISSDSLQCTSTAIKTVYVIDSIWPEDCQADWWYYIDSSNYLTANFIDFSYTANGNISYWQWDFGDGDTSSDQNPVHTYSQEGNYQVCLTIYDSLNNCESTFCNNVEIGYTIPNCEAFFYYFPTDSSNYGWGSNNIQFIDASIGSPDSWYWDFGDGNTSTQQNPIHYYQYEGVYQACLTIENTSDSCVSTYCDLVMVFNDTLPGCSTWFDYQITGLTVDFMGYFEGGSGDISYEWNFGDGSTGTGQMITHEYDTSGIYNIELMAYDSSGCTSITYQSVWVGDISFDITGMVYIGDSLQMADYAQVHLMTFDTLGNGLINIETTDLNDYGGYTFNSVAITNCIYFVQAELTSNSAFYGQYLPTYHLNAINWEEAWPVFPFMWGWGNDIYMMSTASNMPGNGGISGYVSSESSKNLMSDIEIILFNAENKPIKYIRTDNSGNFDFTDLELGTYLIQTEIVGVHSNPIYITLTEEESNANINIVVKNGEALLDIDENPSFLIDKVSNIYPNPANDIFSMNIDIKESIAVEIQVLTQMGQVIAVKEQNLTTGSNQISMNISDFDSGVYLVKVVAKNETYFKRLIKMR